MSLENKVQAKVISRKLQKELAIIELTPTDEKNIHFEGTMITNNFPKELLVLIQDFHKAVDNCMFSIADILESKIQAYDLYLNSNGLSIYHLKLEKDKLSFYTKYPTSKGFVDDYEDTR